MIASINSLRQDMTANIIGLQASIHAQIAASNAATANLQGRLGLLEKKLPNWWQPYVRISVITALLGGISVLLIIVVRADASLTSSSLRGA